MRVEPTTTQFHTTQTLHLVRLRRYSRLMRVRALVGLMAVLLVAGGCGSGDDVATGAQETEAQEQSPAPTPTAEPEPTATPESTATPEPEPTATPEPEPTAAPEPEPTAEILDDEGPDSVYCQLSAQGSALDDSSEAMQDPVRTEGYYTELADLMEQARNVVPESIADHFEVQYENMTKVMDILVAYEWDVLAALAEVVEVSTDAALYESTEALEAYDLEVCGIDPDDGTAGEPAPSVDDDEEPDPEMIEAILETDAGRELIIEALAESEGVTEEQAVCLFDEIESATWAQIDSGEPTTEAMVDLFEAASVCGVDIDSLFS